MPHIGVPELVIILAVVMMIFGVGKLPEIGGAIGKGLREFRQAQLGLDECKDELSKPTESEEEEVNRLFSKLSSLRAGSLGTRGPNPTNK